MQCTACGYEMTAFDKDCLRCKAEADKKAAADKSARNPYVAFQNAQQPVPPQTLGAVPVDDTPRPSASAAASSPPQSPTNAALTNCPACGQAVSRQAISCPRCGQPIAGIATHPMQVLAGNGIGVNGTVLPAELQGFNFGAFSGGWIWAVAHNTWIGLVSLIPYVGWIMLVVLGFKGNEWAWQNRRWESIEQFKSVQRTWGIWGAVFLVIGIVIWLGTLFYSFASLSAPPPPVDNP